MTTKPIRYVPLNGTCALCGAQPPMFGYLEVGETAYRYCTTGAPTCYDEAARRLADNREADEEELSPIMNTQAFLDSL